MEQKRTSWRVFRATIATLLGLLLLMATLPCTGGILEGATRPGMWRCGPFQFYPGAFITVVGAVTVSTGCTLFGIARRNACEIVGWILLVGSWLWVLMG